MYYQPDFKMKDKPEICTNLEELKEEYGKFKEKYDLPEFTELNAMFDIEEIDVDTEFLLRKIRRVIAEKFVGYLRFVEIILNPASAPMFFFKLIKKLDNGDKEVLTRIYEKLGSIEVQIVSLDLDYSEEKEAEFIKKMYEVFSKDVKGDFLKIISKLSNGGGSVGKVNNGSYFG